MDYYDIAEDHGGSLARAFAASKARFCLISFDTDWLYPTAESRLIVHALNAGGAQASFVELSSPFGHDAFLLECPELNRSEEHTSELQSLMRISYAVFCLKKKKQNNNKSKQKTNKITHRQKHRKMKIKTTYIKTN